MTGTLLPQHRSGEARVTNPTADHVFRTFPDPSQVETSPTARSLI